MKLTKQIIMQRVLDYAAENDTPEDEYQWCEENVITIEVGDDVVEHKTVFNHNIYKVGEDFFQVTFMRDNCGYWGDGESYDPVIEEVVPKEIIKTIYVTKS